MTPEYLIISRFIFLQIIIFYAFTRMFDDAQMSGKHDITFMVDKTTK